MSRLLVTGGAGFIGSNFIHYWLKNHPDDSVVNLDKLTYAGNLENLEAVSQDPRYSFVHADIADDAALDKIMPQIDTVVHFAAETHVDRSVQDAAPFVTTNVLGTQRLLAAAVRHGNKRFHHISTDEVFGSLELESTDRFNEQTPYNPSSPYAASKAGADHLVRAYALTYGLPVTISNCTNNFGPYLFPEKFIALAVTNILEGKKIPLYGDGQHMRDWLFVEDHCRAIELILEKGIIGQSYCVGGQTEPVSNLEVARKIISLLEVGEDMIEFIKDRPGHDRRYAVDWSKIHTELGYSPATDFADALAETISWYKNNRLWWQKVKSGVYQDYYKKQYHER